MESQHQSSDAAQPPIAFEMLSEGRKEVMKYMLHTAGEQTAILGATAQKHLAICNMGGIAALLAFAGTKGFDTAGLMVAAFYAFSAGLVLITISMGCSYHSIAQQFGIVLNRLLETSAETQDLSTPDQPSFGKKFVAGLYWFATAASSPIAWLSFLAFATGMVFGGLALDYLPPPKS
ncbi:hypothetical protein ACOTCN_12170 [Achromobacter xylosoxidans]